MKVIFLDIDGVINSTDSILAQDGNQPFSGDQLLAMEELREYFAPDDVPYEIHNSIGTVDPIAVGLINRLSRKGNVKFVLSSSHRAYFSNRYRFKSKTAPEFGVGHHVNLLKTYLRALGIDGYQLWDVTQELRTLRGIEVQRYLEDWSGQEDSVLGITHHVAIDDGADFHPEHCNSIRVDPDRGFTANDYYKACEFLNINESRIIY